MSEKKIEAYFKDRIEAQGGMCVKFPPLFFRGFPDRILLFPKGKVYFVELKRERGIDPTAIQKKVHKKLRDLGCKVDVIGSKEEVDDYILTL